MKWLEVAFAVVVGCFSSGALFAQGAPPKMLEADWMDHDDLGGVTSTAVSPDGKHVYAAAFQIGAVVTFERDEKGKLTHVETLDAAEHESLAAAVALRLSKDGKRAACVAFGASSATIFDRDAETGKLTVTDSVGDMGFCIGVAFSPDAKNLYVGSSSSIKVLSVDDAGKLKQVQDFSQALQPFRSIRSVKVSADGKNVYAASTHSNELVVLKRGDDGQLELLERIEDGGESGASGLSGIHFLSESPDGKNVYTVSGRFGGDNAVCVFARGDGGKLEFVEEFISGGKGGLDGFEGGNEIATSPDGKLVYAVASISDTLARFSRDPATGKLTYIASIPIGEKAEPGSAGVSFSADSRFCYVADEAAGAVWAYRHKSVE